MKLIITILCLIPISLLHSQKTENSTNTLLKNLNEFRDSILSDSLNTYRFNKTIERINKDGYDSKRIPLILLRLQYAIHVNETSLKEINNWLKASEINIELDEDDANKLLSNSLFIQLINEGIYESKYPHKLKQNKLYNEIEFYNFERGEIVGEIGAGSGLFAYLIKKLDIGIKIYANEVKDNLIDYMENEIKKNIIRKDDFIIVKGDSLDTNFPELLDKIIIRNSYHHFSNKPEMLNSVKDHLKMEGELLLQETIGYSHDKSICDYYTTKRKLKKEFRKAGFTLIDEMEIGNEVHLKYMLK